MWPKWLLLQLIFFLSTSWTTFIRGSSTYLSDEQLKLHPNHEKSGCLLWFRKPGLTEKIWFGYIEVVYSDWRKLKITSEEVSRSWLFLGTVGPTRANSGTWKSKLHVAMITIHQKKRLDKLNNFCEETFSRNWVLRCENTVFRALNACDAD